MNINKFIKVLKKQGEVFQAGDIVNQDFVDNLFDKVGKTTTVSNLLKHFKNNGLSEFQIGFVLGIIIDEVAEGQIDDYEHEEFEESMLKMPEENNVLEPSFGFNS